jgi:hypothetical protein
VELDTLPIWQDDSSLVDDMMPNNEVRKYVFEFCDNVLERTAVRPVRVCVSCLCDLPEVENRGVFDLCAWRGCLSLVLCDLREVEDRGVLGLCVRIGFVSIVFCDLRGVENRGVFDLCVRRVSVSLVYCNLREIEDRGVLLSLR